MKITIDRTKCDGYAKCVQASPKVFRLDAKMIAEVIDPKADTDEKILLTAKICPTKAIILERRKQEREFSRRNEGYLTGQALAQVQTLADLHPKLLIAHL
jgi:ferredoxin